MEKRVLLAALLSTIFFAVYAQTIMRSEQPTPPQSLPLHSASPIEPTEPGIIPQQSVVEEESYLSKQEEVVTLESDELALEIGTSSGAIRQAVLKRFPDSSKQRPMDFRPEFPISYVRFDGRPTQWKLQQQTTSRVVLISSGGSHQLTYTLEPGQPLVSIQAQAAVADGSPSIVFGGAWTKGNPLADARTPLEAIFLSGLDGGKYKRLGPIAKGEKIVPRGTFLVSLSEKYFCQSLRLEQGPFTSKLIGTAQDTILVESTGAMVSEGSVANASATLYLGPRDYFYLKRAEFGQAFPIGILGKIGLALLLVLTWIASITKNYGVAIIVFSGLVTAATAPFTILSVKSMKKLQELKPESDRIMAKYKDDQRRAQQEVFALYKTHKVNPAGGCLPLLLQMPIVIALFQALTHFVELRGKSFLWIDDLSMPDRLVKLPLPIPILGEHFNLLPILMAAAMYFQTKLSQGNMPSADPKNPMAQMMSGPMMSILFCVMFYNFQSGLVLYWMTNSLLSMVWYRVAK